MGIRLHGGKHARLGELIVRRQTLISASVGYDNIVLPEVISGTCEHGEITSPETNRARARSIQMIRQVENTADRLARLF